MQVIGSGDVLSAHEQTRLEQVSTLFKRAACEAQAASALAMASPANEASAAAVDGNSAPPPCQALPVTLPLRLWTRNPKHPRQAEGASEENCVQTPVALPDKSNTARKGK